MGFGTLLTSALLPHGPGPAFRDVNLHLLMLFINHRHLSVDNAVQLTPDDDPAKPGSLRAVRALVILLLRFV
jgi:hypothetical protein